MAKGNAIYRQVKGALVASKEKEKVGRPLNVCAERLKTWARRNILRLGPV